MNPDESRNDGSVTGEFQDWNTIILFFDRMYSISIAIKFDRQFCAVTTNPRWMQEKKLDLKLQPEQATKKLFSQNLGS